MGTLLFALPFPTLAPCLSAGLQVSEFYQSRGHYEELISLLESGIGA